MLRHAFALSMILVLSVALSGCHKTTPVATDPNSPQLVDGQAVETPLTSGNLTVWLITGADQSNGRTYLTLAEAMEQKKLIVHETGNVNQLTVENVSDEVVFIPAGSIVKGGKQDRTLGTDLILTKKDGKLPIDAFCVEQGRGRQRGDEGMMAFSGNSAMVSGKAMKVAANSNAGGGNQGEVWQEVAKAQSSLQMAAQADVASSNAQVVAADSPTSFQLTMESEAVKKLTAEHRAALLAKAQGRKDVVGYVYAVNNQIAGGNVYASPQLFQKLWPMLLDSAIVEAVAERAPATQPAVMARKQPTRDQVAAAMKENGEARKREVSQRTLVNTYDAKDSMLLETRDTESGAPVSRQLLIKPEPGSTPAPVEVPQIQLNELPNQTNMPAQP